MNFMEGGLCHALLDIYLHAHFCRLTHSMSLPSIKKEHYQKGVAGVLLLRLHMKKCQFYLSHHMKVTRIESFA